MTNPIPIKEAEQLPYYHKLVQIRKILENSSQSFPFGKCPKAARVVSLALGLEEIAGKCNGISHVWNYDRKRQIYIDLTHDQFTRYQKHSIAIFPDNTLVLSPRVAFTEEERKLKNKFIDEVYDKNGVSSALYVW